MMLDSKAQGKGKTTVCFNAQVLDTKEKVGEAKGVHIALHNYQAEIRDYHISQMVLGCRTESVSSIRNRF